LVLVQHAREARRRDDERRCEEEDRRREEPPSFSNNDDAWDFFKALSQWVRRLECRLTFNHDTRSYFPPNWDISGITAMDRLDSHIRDLISRLMRGKYARSNFDERPKAAWALRQIGPDAKAAVPLLIEALKDPNEELRREAATALGFIAYEAKEAIPALIAAAEDPSPRVRFSAIGALGALCPGKEAIPTFIRALGDDSEKLIPSQALFWLQQIGSDAVADLIAALGDRVYASQ